MNVRSLPLATIRFAKAHPVWFGLGALGLVVIILLFLPKGRHTTTNDFFTIRRADFLISVVEGGTLQAVDEVSIRNEVEGTSRIIYIVPEGSYVKKGDLLVELDSSSARDSVNLQQINFEKSQFALIQAKELLEIQKSIMEGDIRTAELKLEFAKIDLTKYLEGEARQEQRKAELDIANLLEKLAIDEDRWKWSEKLAEKGFETKTKLDQDKLTVLQTKLNLESASNSFWMIKTFDFPKKSRQYESAVEEAKDDLVRTKHQGQRKLAQYEADVRTQEITVELSKYKLERDQNNLEACKVYAPQDGLVVYPVSDSHYSSESLIEEGAMVRNRQSLVKLPDVSEMKVTVKIHESHINMIGVGQPAFIVLDSMPDQRFNAVVSKVGLLPDSQSRYGNPNLKLYATEILVTDPLPDVKPGVSARAEIVITNLQNVISVPIQAVATKQGRPVVYVDHGGSPRAVPVAVGMYNTKFIEVVSGLKEADRVLLAPPFDTEERDIAGGVLGSEEKDDATNAFARAQAALSNQVARVAEEKRMDEEELRKKYDVNGDGELDEKEKELMRAGMRGSYSSGEDSISSRLDRMLNTSERGSSKKSSSREPSSGRSKRGAD